ncbi:MAG: thioredoxin family protein [Burkholderiaceae bacterium]|nr:thioredoxin family protein [Burkholderiaceae bacterium]
MSTLPPTSRLIACLCAEWCGTCRDWRALFDEVTARHPRARVRWIDIEDEADLVGDIDVETFPTVLVVDGGERVRFFGPLLPHAQTLARLLDSLEPGGAEQAVDGDVKALARRLAAG